jgi:ADP-heptose:LPS heptosyltransferase
VAVAVALVYRALKLGDFLTAVPALRAVRAAFPEHEVVLAGPAWVAPLAALTGAVDRVLPAAALAPLAWSGPPPDVAVNVHGRGPHSHAVVRATRPRRFIAFGEPGPPGPQWDDDEHEVARWCRLLTSSGIPADPRDLGLPAPPSPIEPGCTVVHPGASARARRWPVSRWVAVARAERAQGRRVVVTGSAGERGLAAAVARSAGLGAPDVLAGRTSLLELAGVVAGAGRVVSGDTGVSHLATAFSTPSVSLFGPVSPARWGPPAGDPRHVALWAGHEGDPHGTRPDPGLLRIQPADVLAALAALTPRYGRERGQSALG